MDYAGFRRIMSVVPGPSGKQTMCAEAPGSEALIAVPG